MFDLLLFDLNSPRELRILMGQIVLAIISLVLYWRAGQLENTPSHALSILWCSLSLTISLIILYFGIGDLFFSIILAVAQIALYIGILITRVVWSIMQDRKNT